MDETVYAVDPVFEFVGVVDNFVIVRLSWSTGKTVGAV
jgi:hypothetical protein